MSRVVFNEINYNAKKAPLSAELFWLFKDHKSVAYFQFSKILHGYILSE